MTSPLGKILGRLRPALLVAILASLLALAVRIPGLGSILTADEPQWIFRAQSFFTALAKGDLGGTFQGTHPGVVPMFLIGTGLELRERFTGERLESPTVGAFRTAAKLPVAIAVSLGIGAAAALIAHLWNIRNAIGAGVFLSLDPFFVGHSQLAHVDALLGIFMLLSVLTLLSYVRSDTRRVLVLSGVLGGLALLTKLPAVLLFPLTVAVLILFPQSRPRWFRDATIWIAVAAATFLVAWPSLWLNVLPNARYAARDVRSVVTTSHFGESAEILTRDAFFYVRALLTRATPATLLLAIAGAYALFRSAARRREAVALLLFFAGFLLIVHLVGKRADRYLLPALLVLDVFAGVSLAELVRRGRFGAALAGSVVGFLLLLNLQMRPYAVTYANPFSPKEEFTQSGWGEGLEQAAVLLNTHPLAAELHVASWYPVVFGEFFRGSTMSLSSRDDPRVGYVVTYRNMRGRPPDAIPTAVLAEFAQRTPVAVIRVAGMEMAWVYATDSVGTFPKHVGEIVRVGAAERGTGNALTAVEVGQIVMVDRDGWSGVRLAFATFSSRNNTGELLLHVRETPESSDLRVVRVDVSQLKDTGWTDIRFDPLGDSKGKRYYLTLTSPTGEVGNAVTVRYQPKDILPGHFVVRRQSSRPVEAAEGDLAYSLMYASSVSRTE